MLTVFMILECKDTMDAGILQNTAGGESMPGAGAVDTCKQTCLSDVNCLAVDHAPNKGCWKHTSVSMKSYWKCRKGKWININRWIVLDML